MLLVIVEVCLMEALVPTFGFVRHFRRFTSPCIEPDARIRCSSVSEAALAGVPVKSSTAARGVIHVVRNGPRSVVTRAFAESPLRLLNPSNHGDAAWVFTSTYGGGFVGGDALDLEIDVGEGAAALLQTQASTKVYRSPRGVSSALQARVASGARLLLLPDPTVCFGGATLDQAQHVDVHGDGSLVLMDWLTAGRRASGERWVFDRYASRLTVRYDNQVVLRDSLFLSHAEGSLPERMGRFDCVCLIVLIGQRLRQHAKSACDEIAGFEPRTRADLLMAAAPIGRDNDAGCVIRMAGESVEDVGRAARTWLHFVPGLLGDNPWARKW
jgi:urease accessory protein